MDIGVVDTSSIAVIQTLVDWLDQVSENPLLAYGVIFCVLVVTGSGLPITEELIVVTAGFLISREDGYDPIMMFVVCYTGILIADSIIVWIGWHFGKAVLHRRWIKRLLHPRRLMWARHRVVEHSVAMITASRFIPGSRYGTLLLAGMMRVPRWKFLATDAVAAVFSVILQLSIGYGLGTLYDGINEVVEHRGMVALIMLGIGVVFVGAYILYRHWRRGRKTQFIRKCVPQ